MNVRAMLWLLAGALLAGWTVPATAKPPAGAILTVEIRSVDGLEQAINDVAAGLQLPAGGQALAKPMADLLGVDNFAGVEKSQRLRLYVFAGDDEAAAAPPLVLSLPVADRGSVYLAALATKLPVTKKKSGKLLFFAPQQAPPPPGSERYALAVGDRVFVGGNEDSVRAIGRAAKSGLIDADRKIPLNGTVAFEVDVAALADKLAEAMENDEGFKRAMAAEGQPAPGGIDVGGILKAEVAGLQALVRQIDAVMLCLDADTSSVTVNTRLDAAENTPLARVLRKTRAPRRDFRGLPPSNAVFARVGHIGDVDAIVEPLLAFAGELYAGMGPGFAAMGDIMEAMAADIKGLFTGDYAFAVLDSDESDWSLIEYFGITDAARARSAFEAGVARMQKLPATAGVGQSMTKDVDRSHKGVLISSYRYSATIDPALAAATRGVKMMTNMLVQTAFIDDVGIYTIGPKRLMEASIDRLSNPGLDMFRQTVFRNLFAKLPDEPVSMSTLSLMGYLRLAIAAMPGVNPRMLGQLQSAGAGMADFAYTRSRTVVTSTKISMAEINAVKAIVPALGMAMMMGGMGGQ